MLSYTELKKGVVFSLDDEPYEVLEYNFTRKQQRKPVVQTKIKNLISGKIIERGFRQSDFLKPAEITKKDAVFIYSNKGNIWFRSPQNPKDRFSLSEDIAGEKAKFLKENAPVSILEFRDKIIGISLPIKMDFKVIEAPPAVRGNTAQGGNKTITLENGLEIQAPLFINEGDIVRINTETGEYSERVEKK